MWHRRYGNWWMIQWAFDGWLSFGIHIDFRHRKRGDGLTYGPYIDFHIGIIILSLGLRPVYAGEIELRSSIATWKNIS